MVSLRALNTSRFSYLAGTQSVLLHERDGVNTNANPLRSTHLLLHPTPSFLLQIIPFKPATFPSPTRTAALNWRQQRETRKWRGSSFSSKKKKKNPQEQPRRLLQISCQKNICLTLELHAREIKGNLFVLCNQTLEKCLLYFSSSLENYLDTLCPALSYPFY